MSNVDTPTSPPCMLSKLIPIPFSKIARTYFFKKSSPDSVSFKKNKNEQTEEN